MTVQYVVAVKNARLQATADKIDTGSGTAALLIYTAPRPATGATPTGATLLATLNLPNPCGSVANGALTLDLPAETTISGSGTHAWGRIVDRDGGAVADMATGLSGSGAEIEIPIPTLTAGATLKKTTAVITHA